MQINTTRFGAVEVQPSDVLEFPLGLIGLEPWTKWVVLADGENPGLGWLQSTERADLALAVVSPRRYVPDYKVRLSARDLSPLEAPEGVTPQVVVAVSSHGVEGQGAALSLNLKAPILVCLETRRGRQVVAKDDHPVQHWLGGPAQLRRSA
ncbi:flagellar assembly protein FliW [Botrimarina mediterranea]|uniref:Flagellar assembly factor FliW n=1 Tax=Botrimarina mediterranea TaxID=2528022 RepID=A0A518K4H4_9BACT|nr:flagellar assembly protein FliW [Botrimarina mediterranea]QDV72692.1 Flagellar assembly factor FliW [Botrimarina mediterranea]QDV77264.1 Flagellar assembly factor FliW [Planctomycetes bacterium K2D]